MSFRAPDQAAKVLDDTVLQHVHPVFTRLVLSELTLRLNSVTSHHTPSKYFFTVLVTAAVALRYHLDFAGLLSGSSFSVGPYPGHWVNKSGICIERFDVLFSG